MKSSAEQRHEAAPPVQWRDSHRNSVRFYQQLSKTSLRKKRKQNPQQSGGWQHATNEKQMCVRPWPMVWRPARDQCVIGERLEEEGCVAADGRVEGVNSVAVNSLNWEDVTGRKVAAFRSYIIVQHVCASSHLKQVTAIGVHTARWAKLA